MPLLGDRKTDRTKAKCSCSAPVITCDCFVACHDLKMSICLFHCVANVNAIKMCSFGRQPKRRTKKVRRAKRRQKNEGKRTNWKRNAKSFKLSFCTLLLHTVVAFLFPFSCAFSASFAFAFTSFFLWYSQKAFISYAITIIVNPFFKWKLM